MIKVEIEKNHDVWLVDDLARQQPSRADVEARMRILVIQAKAILDDHEALRLYLEMAGWTCPYCHRHFIHRMPHRCAGGFRKRFKKG